MIHEPEAPAVADAVCGVLRRLGHAVVRLGAGARLFDSLRRRDRDRSGRLDGVVNLAACHGDRGRAAQVPALLTSLGIPFTGSDPLALTLALGTDMSRSFAAGHGIRTAPFALVSPDDADPAHGLVYPLLVRPLAVDCPARCADADELHDRLARLRRAGHPLVLVEEHLPGDEYAIGVVGNGDETDAFGVPWTDERQAEVLQLARTVHRVFGCSDVSLVSLRCDRAGEPAFVSVDPLPDLHPAADLARAARRHGWNHNALVARILASARERWHSPPALPDPPQAPSARTRCASPSPTTPTLTSSPI